MKYLAIVGAVLLAATAAAEAPAAGNAYVPGPKVEFAGQVAKIQLVRGQGMPYLEVDRDGKSVKVILGSMRYLMSNDFNPKAGERIQVEGFQQDDGTVFAKTITLPDEDKSLELRRDNGQPVWQRGRHGHKNMRMSPNNRKEANP